MSTSIPSADTLLESVIACLERELLPGLDGYHRFQVRIAANALKIVLREQRLGAAHAQEDAAAVARLLAQSGGAAGHGSWLDVADLLRDGTLDADAPGLAQSLRAMLRRQLAVDNPAWADEADRRREE